MIPRRDSRKGRAKVKTGCRTCKTRKVKCDEGRPACNRCLSTGRICDGYGIWGGGGNGHGFQQRQLSFRSTCRTPQPPLSIWAVDVNNDEKGYLDWFKCRTTTKLPGTFVSSFWDTLLLQTCLSEPAVLHAVLALSSFHKWGTIESNDRSSAPSIPPKGEKIMLQHYIKAINFLRASFLIKDKGSFRAALIACVVFVSLELLRGNIETAQLHLQNGLNIFIETQMIFRKDIGVLYSELLPGSADYWIFEVFSRLQLQLEMLRPTSEHPFTVLQFAGDNDLVQELHSTKAAWQELDRLFNEIIILTNQARQSVKCRCESYQYFPKFLLERRESIQADLTHWLDSYLANSKIISKCGSAEENKVTQLLYAYHKMAGIMAATCLLPNNEVQYDSHTKQFVLLIQHLIQLWTLSTTMSPTRTLPDHLMGLSGSTVDVGWIPPLFYTATKCRSHRIRLQAIRLLESSPHREGFWEAKTTACVARKVMELEERDWYHGIEMDDDFPLCNLPCPHDLSLPTIPGTYRMREVEVNPLGSPTNRILLFCKRKQQNIDQRVLASVYSMRTQLWTDEEWLCLRDT